MLYSFLPSNFFWFLLLFYFFCLLLMFCAASRWHSDRSASKPMGQRRMSEQFLACSLHHSSSNYYFVLVPTISRARCTCQSNATVSPLMSSNNKFSGSNNTVNYSERLRYKIHNTAFSPGHSSKNAVNCSEYTRSNDPSKLSGYRNHC